PQAKGETDEIDGAGEPHGRDGFVADAADEGQIGRGHRDLPELRERHRRGELERLGQLTGKMRAGSVLRRSRRNRCPLIDECHDMDISTAAGGMRGLESRLEHDRKKPALGYDPLRWVLDLHQRARLSNPIVIMLPSVGPNANHLFKGGPNLQTLFKLGGGSL